MTGAAAGGDGPIEVLVAFPAEPPPDQVERLAAWAPQVRVTVEAYEEPADFRIRRRAREDLDRLRASAPALTAEQQRAFASAEVLLAFDVPIDVARWAPQLRWLQTPTTGIDQLWGAGLGEAGIAVTNTVGIAATSIAEFVMARVLAIWKRFPELDRLQREHRWEMTTGRRLAGSTMAIVGLGTIGTELAIRARAFGVHVVAIRRHPDHGAGPAHEVHPPEALHDVLGRCDVAVLCLPSTDETRRLIDRPALAAMKPGGVLVNVARGGHVDEAALIEALTSGHLGAAAIDVAVEEPLPPTSPLWEAPNLLVSPHSCASLDGYWEGVYDILVDNLARYVDGGELRNLVDPATGYGVAPTQP